MTYRTANRRAQLTEAHPAAWEAGYDWGYNLQIGDTFRGAHLEGCYRELSGDALAAFEVGADSALQGWKTLRTMGARIVALEAK